MNNYEKIISVEGDLGIESPLGVASIKVDHETGQVRLELPVYGGGQYFRFTGADWDQIVAMISEAELHRGKIVSTSWDGK